MLILPSLLAVAVWFNKPPQGAQARITVMNESSKTTFQIVGIDKAGVELSPNDFSAQPDQLTVGPRSPQIGRAHV